MKSLMLGIAGAMVIGLAATAPNPASAASPISTITMGDSMRQSASFGAEQVRWRGGGGGRWGGGWRGGYGGGWRGARWGGGPRWGWRGGWGHGPRWGWGHRHGWRGGWGPGPLVGLGLGLGLGAAALATAPVYGYGYGYRTAYVGGGLQPWTPAWYRYCSSRYRSFDPNTGYFVTYSGRQAFCR
ncbi:BA14K family protein [Rhodoligotrophos ferricapiens]|uniref:BA14K family protein n=1 Tax=Rhodoligotrophos ferricapiens TaxID=3069264 RepID=UPI00315CB9FF